FFVGASSHRTIVRCDGCSCQFAIQLQTTRRGGSISTISPCASYSFALFRRSCAPISPRSVPVFAVHRRALAGAGQRDASVAGFAGAPFHGGGATPSRCWTKKS